VVVSGLTGRGQPELVRAAVDRLVSTVAGEFITVFQPVFEGWTALITGRVATAVTQLRDFRPNSPGHGGGWTALLELQLAQAQGMAGDAVGAREALMRAEMWRHPGVVVIEPQFTLARAWLAAAEGSATTAVRHARQAATLAARSGQLAIEVLARHAAVSFGDRAQAARLAELARQVPGRHTGRVTTVQPGDRETAGCLNPHRGRSHLPSVRQARTPRPCRAVRAVRQLTDPKR
jgi:hypothetical protein